MSESERLKLQDPDEFYTTMSHGPGVADMVRPPVNRAMRVLDRSFFNKIIKTSAARVIDRKNISKCKDDLGQDILKLDRMQAVKLVQDPQGAEAKALLLKPEIKPDGKLRPSGNSSL